MKVQHLGTFYILGAAMLWSTAGLFMGLLVTLDVWTILFWRSFFGAIAVGGAALMRGDAGFHPRLLRRSWFVATGCSAFGMVTFIPALQLTSVANVAMIHASLPVLAAIASALTLRERPARPTVFFSGAALVGAAVIFTGSPGGSSSQLGNLLALLMTISIAFMTVALRADRGRSVLWIIAVSNVIAAIVALCFAPSISIDLDDALLLACFSLIQMVLGLVLYSKGAQLLPSAEVALFSLVEVPLSPLWVWLTFDQRPGLPSVFGGAIIVTTAIGHILTRWRRDADRQRRCPP
ncbi:Permease of the drug/metabolite transporter (DMT) superfamily [Rhizobium tibeticum]|uniref:Carboxylate/amino acid/amine transporter n=1 Tax=Rhizobium tibeticum TaxID=501024 RepID=A0A1H8S6N0_9HYPH|nr:DMT family transporter [Rhizobium tibeticum]SEI10232.1 carboxylate/amino acid/amine transporter [Rhizobium tibeticum]SEO74196.1 Permease of the drug/metabolite transporter (DMT) superfamily [Rhizobium tibeticum]